MILKRCLDWLLIAIMFSLLIAKMGILTQQAKEMEQDNLRAVEPAKYANNLPNLKHAIAIAAVLLAINVLVTLVLALHAQKCFNNHDAVSNFHSISASDNLIVRNRLFVAFSWLHSHLSLFTQPNGLLWTFVSLLLPHGVRL